MPTQSERPHAWREVLDQIEQGLKQFLAAAPQPPASSAPPTATTAEIPPGPLDDRFTHLHARLEQAEQEAARIQAALTADIEALGQWLRDAAEVRLRLEERLRGQPMVAAARARA